MKTEKSWDIRKMIADDTAFIFDSWLDSYAIACPDILPKIYRRGHHKLIETFLEEPENDILIACNPEDQDHIFGYICAKRVCSYAENISAATGNLHYIYVKAPMRDFGIGKGLLRALPYKISEHSHRTRSLEYLRLSDSIYNPYCFYLL